MTAYECPTCASAIEEIGNVTEYAEGDDQGWLSLTQVGPSTYLLMPCGHRAHPTSTPWQFIPERSGAPF